MGRVRISLWLLTACIGFFVISQAWERGDMTMAIQRTNDETAHLLTEPLPLQTEIPMLINKETEGSWNPGRLLQNRASSNRFDAVLSLLEQQNKKAADACIGQSKTAFMYINTIISLKLRI
jgi:hypothetical protein